MLLVTVLALILFLSIVSAADETENSSLRLRSITTSLVGKAVLFVNFTVENTGDRDVKSFTLSCAARTGDGTEIGQVSKTFGQIVTAKRAEVYEGIEIGPVYPQTQTVQCHINDIVIRE